MAGYSFSVLWAPRSVGRDIQMRRCIWIFALDFASLAQRKIQRDPNPIPPESAPIVNARVFNSYRDLRKVCKCELLLPSFLFFIHYSYPF